MKKFLLTICALLMAVSGAWALDVNIANPKAAALPDPTYGSITNNVFTTNEASGLAGITISAPSDGVTLSANTVNAEGYGKCFTLTTKNTSTHTITLSAPNGYIITGFYIGGCANSYKNTHTLVSGETSVVVSSPPYNTNDGSKYYVPKNFSISGLSSQTATFTITTPKGGNALYIPIFTITVKESSATAVNVTYNILYEDETIPVTKTQYTGEAPSLSYDYCTFKYYANSGCTGDELTALTAETTMVYAKCTYTGPVASDCYYLWNENASTASASNLMYYNGTNNYPNNDGSVTATDPIPTNYIWQFKGNPIEGFNILNISANKYFGGITTVCHPKKEITTETTANSNFVPVYSGESYNKWYSQTYKYFINYSGTRPYASWGGINNCYTQVYKVKFVLSDTDAGLKVGSTTISDFNSYYYITSSATLSCSDTRYGIGSYDGYATLAEALANDADGIINLSVGYSVDGNNGNFQRDGSTNTGWCDSYVSTNSPVGLKISISSASSNNKYDMKKINNTSCYIASGPDNSATYTITAPYGYHITGYSIIGRTAADAGNNETITPSVGGSATVFEPGITNKATASGLDTESTSFTLSGNNKSITVTNFVVYLEYILPVKVTTITDDDFDSETTWYTMTVNGLPVYAAYDSSTENYYMTVDPGKSTLASDLWCFVIDGENQALNIYCNNGGYGATAPISATATSDGTNLILSSDGTYKTWDISTVSDGVYTICSSSVENKYFSQYGGTGTGSSYNWRVCIYGTESPDAGCQFTFTEVTDITSATTTLATTAATINKSGVGYPDDSTTKTYLTAAISSATASQTAASYSYLSETAMAYLKSSASIVMPTDGKVYKFTNVHSDGTTYYLYDNSGTLSISTTALDDGTDEFICHKVSDGNYLFVSKAGKYLRAAWGSNASLSDTYATWMQLSLEQFPVIGTYVTVATSEKVFGSFSMYGDRASDNTSNSYMLISKGTSGAPGTWNSGDKPFYTDAISSSYFITECDDYYNKVTMNAVDGKTYATVYLPFSVKIPAKVKAYAATAAISSTMTLTKIADGDESGILPKNTAAILYGYDGTVSGTQYLSPAEGAGSFDGTNVLAGTVTDSETAITAGDIYVLYNGANGIGFYPSARTTYPLGKAYLPKTSANGIKAFLLNFDEETTSINGINSQTGSDAPIFDLSGRRVEKAQRGIYIQNGKKFIVK